MTEGSTNKAKVLAEAARRGLTSFMNDTKWRELQRAALEELPFFPPAYQRKDILHTLPEPARLDADVWIFGDSEGRHLAVLLDRMAQN